MIIRNKSSHLALLAVAAITLTCAPALALAAPTDPGPAVTAAEAARHLQELTYQRDIAQIRADLLEAQTGWFEILVGGGIAFYGALISAVVIFFTIRTSRSAIAEAKASAADAIRPEREALASAREEIERLVGEATTRLNAIHGQSEEELARLRSIAPGNAPPDAATRRSLHEVAEEAQAKPRGERSADDFRALINVAALHEDWPLVERRASAMAYLHETGGGGANLAFALFAKGFALGELKQFEGSLAAYDDVLSRFGDSAEPILQEHVAKALVNKGGVLGQLGRYDEALVSCDEVLRRFGNSAEEALREEVARALVNKGIVFGKLERYEEVLAASEEVLRRFGDNTEQPIREMVAKVLATKGVSLGKLGRSEEALLTYDEMLRRFGGSAEAAMRERVEKVLFNMACLHGQAGDAAASIAALTKWRDRAEALDCAMIAGDPDFDPVRNDPAFVAFLKKNGCAPKRARRPRK